MNTETTVSTATETQNPAAETPSSEVVTPEVVETEASAEGEAPKALDPEQMRERMQRRIDRKHALASRALAENEQLKQRLHELSGQAGKPEQPQGSTQDPHVLAREIARRERFDEEANRLVSEGSKKHSDFMPALKALADEVGPFVVNGLPSPFMEAVREVAEKPVDLLYHLGKNPELAEELSELSPLKLAKRLDRIERELADAGKTKTSSAPRPLETVRAKAAESALPRDDDSTDAWIAKERKRMEAKGITRYG
jgi:hypothetical protein